MSQINTVDARPLFTKTLVDVYKERVVATGFLRSLFRPVETSSKEVSIEVQRATEKVAVDVFRGTEGNRNRMDLFTEKIWIPPYYREFFDATQLRFYDVMFGSLGTNVDEVTFSEWISEVADRLEMLQMKIERAIELQCAQVLQTGVLTLQSSTNIDFKRKAASLVDIGAPDYWTQATADPIEDIENGCNFMRQVGKAQGGEFNMILGSGALRALLNNTIFKERADLRRVALDDISMPQRQGESVGAVFHGVISAGSYRVRLWTYPQFYDNAGGVSTPYIDDNKIILVPLEPRFTLNFASVPKLIRDVRNAEFPEFIRQQRGAFTVGNYIDERAETHVFDIKSAPIAVPVAVDTIYTAQVIA